MDALIEYFRGITWEGPAIIVVVFLVIFIVLRQWSIIFVIVVTLFFAALSKNLMIKNGETDVPVVSMSMLIYSAGCGIILIIAVSNHFKRRK